MRHLLTTFPLARVARPVTTGGVYIQVGPLLQTERTGGDFEGGHAVRILQSQFVQVSRDRRGCHTAVVRHREREDSRHFSQQEHVVVSTRSCTCAEKYTEMGGAPFTPNTLYFLCVSEIKII